MFAVKQTVLKDYVICTELNAGLAILTVYVTNH